MLNMKQQQRSYWLVSGLQPFIERFKINDKSDKTWQTFQMLLYDKLSNLDVKIVPNINEISV